MPAEDASVDHYAALQVSSSAQSSEIKSSYRKLGQSLSVTHGPTIPMLFLFSI